MNIKNLKEVQSRKLKSFHCTYRKLVAEISAATRLAYDEQKDKKKKKQQKKNRSFRLYLTSVQSLQIKGKKCCFRCQSNKDYTKTMQTLKCLLCSAKDTFKYVRNTFLNNSIWKFQVIRKSTKKKKNSCSGWKRSKNFLKQKLIRQSNKIY